MNEHSLPKDIIKQSLLRNTKLMVRLADDADNTYYNSRIEDVEEETMLISMPSYKGLPVHVKKDAKILISSLTPNGRLMFESKVEGIIKEGIYMLRISLPKTGQQEQMRQFYRVPIYLRIGIVADDLKAVNEALFRGEEIDFQEASIENISGGGCRLTTKIALKENEDVILDFSGTNVDGVDLVPCRVVRVTAQSNEKKIASLRYWNIDERVRDKLIRYVFKRQMELRQLLE